MNDTPENQEREDALRESILDALLRFPSFGTQALETLLARFVAPETRWGSRSSTAIGIGQRQQLVRVDLPFPIMLGLYCQVVAVGSAEYEIIYGADDGERSTTVTGGSWSFPAQHLHVTYTQLGAVAPFVGVAFAGPCFGPFAGP